MGNSSDERHTLLTDFDTPSAYSEAMQTLFANIRFQLDREPGRHTNALLIATPVAYGDYVSIVANLAIVAAQSGTRTILVDADLRHSLLQKRFGLEKAEGLSDALEDDSLTPEKLSSYLQPTFITTLQILSAGTKTAPGNTLLLSPRLKEVVHYLSETHSDAENVDSLVLFHSAPVLSGADASLIGALVDYTVLAIIVDHTTRAQAKQAHEQLLQAHANIVGTALVRL